MGVTNLWKTLKEIGAVENSEGVDAETHAQIARELNGKVIAIDLSPWLMQVRLLLTHLPVAPGFNVTPERVCMSTS
jgi:hypothetical protein